MEHDEYWCDGLLVEAVEAGTDAHIVQPDARDGPGDERAEDGLPRGEGQDIAIEGKEPSSSGARDESGDDENRIWKVKRRENCGAEDDGEPGTANKREEAVGKERVHADLLQEAESEVVPEMARGETHGVVAVARAEDETGSEKGNGQRAEQEGCVE